MIKHNMMNYYVLGSISCIGLSSIYLMNRYSNFTNNTKSVKTPSIEKPRNMPYWPLNLTPHSINIYDDSDNFLFGIKPEDAKMQLRISSSKSSDKEKLYEFQTSNFEWDGKNCDESCFTKRNIHSLYNHHVDLQILYGTIPVKERVVYDTLDGIDELRTVLKDTDRPNAIIVSTMVAEFMMENMEKYNDLEIDVLVPNSDPKSSVRDKKTGSILGVRSLINYGKLTKTKN